MLEYQQRVVIEREEIDTKLEKLLQFLNSETFNSLNEKDQELLKRQAIIMGDYSSVLAERISLFNSL